MSLLIALVIVLGIVYASFLNWRRAVKTVFLILVFEGALRKWIIPQASEMIYFLKDFVLLGAYIQYYGALLMKGRTGIKNNWIDIPILLAALWCGFQVFNPSLGSPVIGIFGFKSYFFYIPLIWMLPDLFRSKDDLYKFLRSHLLLAIPVGIIGIIQFVSPYNSPINSYAWGEEYGRAWIHVGNTLRARTTGTFSYVNNYSAYLTACFALLIPLISIRQSQRWRGATILTLFMVVVNLFMTGSRGPVIGSCLLLLGFLATTAFTQPAVTSRFVKLLPQLIVVAAAACIFFAPAIDAFWQRTAANQADLSYRVQNGFTEPFKFVALKELDGYGTGATQVGASALRRALDLPPGERIAAYYEEEAGRIILEIGPLGFALWYALRASLLITLWMVFRRTKDPFLAQLVLCAFLFQLINIRSQLVFHHTFAVYYWFFSSFIFVIPRLEQVEYWYQRWQPLRQDVDPTYLPNSSHR